MRKNKTVCWIFSLIALVVFFSSYLTKFEAKGVKIALAVSTPSEAQIRAKIGILGERLFAIQLLVFYCPKYGYNDIGTAYKIIDAESNWNQYAKSPDSSAKGYAQFLNSTWKETMKRMKEPIDSNIYDTENHIKAFCWLLAKDGTRHWNESRSVWGNKNLVKK